MTKDVKARDRKFLARDEAPDGLQVTRSEGSFVFDEHGRRYVDFLMGWYVGSTGWGNAEIRDRMRRDDGPEFVAATHLYEGWVELAELIAGIVPGHLQRSYRTTSGTEAVEVALQAAMVTTGRSRFLAIEGCYHGNSLLARSVAGTARERYGTAVPGCEQLSLPLDGRAADRLETKLKRRDVAAFILEPIVSALGVVIPDLEFMHRAEDLCRRYGTLLVLDEVVTGFGRTGRMFGAEHYELEPDILCLAKGMSGGYGGLGAAVMTNRVAYAIQDEMSFFSTFGWHPLAVVGAIGNVRYLIEHRDALLANVALLSDVFYRRLTAIDFGRTVKVRAAGLAIAVETGDAAYAEALRTKCRKAGLLIGADGGTLMLFPALTVDRGTTDEGLDMLDEVLSP